MIFPEGGVQVEDAVLFGKYQICRVIGLGRCGTVFLAKHLALDEYRAIKRIPKDGREEPIFLREAMILKSLRHPGIPVIYDLEQDQEFHYLIEEYLEGESLFTLISKQGNLTRAKTISHGIELCHIMNYLHSLKPNPILYLDLQPKNLLLCDGALKLIDFDQAVTATLAGKLKKRYGTVGCAAPEQFTKESLDVRTDIYAIGALLHYMGTGAFPNGEITVFSEEPDDELSAIIERCLSPSKEARYPDVECLLQELLKLESGVFKQGQISLLNVAVAGSSHGMGATHASLGLSSYFSHKGMCSLYVEHNETGAVFKWASYFNASPDKYGIYHLCGWDLKPKYGPSVQLEPPKGYHVWIEDYGTEIDKLCAKGGRDLIVLLCGGRWWGIHDSIEALRLLTRKKYLRVVFNHVPETTKLTLPGSMAKLSCHRMPFCPELEKTDLRTEAFWEEVLKETPAFQALSGQSANVLKRTKNAAVRNRIKCVLKRIIRK